MFWCKVGKPYLLLFFTYYYLWLCWTSCIHDVTAGNDSLKPGDTMNATTTQLCSQNDKYCMKFVPLLGDQDGLTLTYLGIYPVIKSNWVIWIANRNQPIFNNSGLLSLDHSNNLKLESQGGKPIILYSSPPQSTNNNNTVATLLDTGNFVVQELHPNGSTKSVLWQSFDHPTGNLLPGMKLGVNHKTGHKWSLISSVSDSNPATGPFTLEWDPTHVELFIRRHRQVIWRSGKLGKNRFFEHVPKKSQRMYNYTVVSNKDEEYFTITNLNDQELTRWSLLETGQLQDSEGRDIARADMCYGYNDDEGCQIWEKIPSCRHPVDIFELRASQPKYINSNTIIERNKSYGISDCKAWCWSNCSCVGFYEFNEDGTGCIFFLGDLTEDTNIASRGKKFYTLVKNTQRKSSIKKRVWISAMIATIVLISCTSILCLAIIKRKHVLEDMRKTRMETQVQNLTALDGFTSIDDLQEDLNMGHDLKVFSYASVMEAIGSFSSENKLGQGGFGPVYKGILTTGQEVAVKRLSQTSGQGVVEFKNELNLICELQHMNLVQLLGFCIHEQERMLIYEYMPNKSLDFFLFDDTRSKLLNWQKRFNIIEGISQGLLYLHKYSRLKIIHRDLKASNILLDENMNPKISDFGMARIFSQQESTMNTNRIVGTYGYLSPEYVMEGVFSTKSDVYSFGVLLLEIVSGRRNNSFYDDDHLLNIVGHAWELWNDDRCLQLMDPSLNDTFILDEVQRCIQIGLLCVEHYAKNRPNMFDIISMLTNKSVAVSLPRRPAFYVGRPMFEEKTSSECTESISDSTKETILLSS